MQVSFGTSRIICLMAAVLINSFSDRDASASNIGGAAEKAAVAKVSKASKPIKDAEGRIRYIVDLVDDDLGKPARFANASEKILWKQMKSVVLIDETIKLRGIKLLGSTSLVGTSFIAYLNEKQVEQLSKDSRVARITEDAYMQTSALWNNSPEPNGQTTPQVWPWGLSAMLSSGASSNGGATVYVLDTGVEIHADLPGLAASDRLTAFATDSFGAPINPTGCYSHATHVAGIIGAANDNKGTVGVLPGVRLVSIALGDSNATASAPCPGGSSVAIGSFNSAFSGLTQGLEKAYERILLSNKVGIVNISFNPVGGENEFAYSASVGSKMREVAFSTFENGVGYKGALIVQSAGNIQEDACGYAYNAPHPSDGILVVGGLDEYGRRVERMNSLNLDGYITVIPGVMGESRGKGSNVGACVEMWAPSQRVYSTWTTSNGTGYLTLSGTSMAAPHVSGLAAWVLENDPSIMTSEGLEAAVRAKLVTLSGSGLSMPRFANQGETARPTLEVMINALRRTNGPFLFVKSANEAQDIKWEALGASACSVVITRSGAYYAPVQLGVSGSVGTNVPGNPNAYTYTFTCTSPENTQTSVAVQVGVKRLVTVADWYASTTSTGGNWQHIPNGNSVWWSVTENGGFDQFYNSAGADYCHIQSFGYHGNPLRDVENPNYVSGSVQSYGQTLLWDSLINGGVDFPPSGSFATFYFGNTQSSPYGIAPYDGYKWRLDCKVNDFGGNSKKTVMYGTGY